MKSKLLVVDIDDTVLEWKEGFFDFIEPLGWYLNSDSKCDSWDIWTWICNAEGVQIEKQRVIDLITEFNAYPRVLRPLVGSMYHLRLLASEGVEIIGLTSFGSCPNMTFFRQEYLDVVFGGTISKCIVLPLGACKESWLKDLDPDWFVEDNKAHAQKACGLGIKTFLLKTTYNKGCEESIYVDGWSDIHRNIILELDGVH
tara:strand:- start:986 stop:1585 length:600 start_codon:yes stop_codon:yes gene_type:complete